MKYTLYYIRIIRTTSHNYECNEENVNTSRKQMKNVNCYYVRHRLFKFILYLRNNMFSSTFVAFSFSTLFKTNKNNNIIVYVGFITYQSFFVWFD